MKAICRVLPNPSSTVALLRYVYRQRKKDDATSLAEVASVGIHEAHEGGILVGDAAVDAVALDGRAGHTGTRVRHIVLSLEEDCPDAVVRLQKASVDWVTRFASGRAWVSVIHKNPKGHPHLHLIVENRNEKGKGLRWSRADVKEMAGMAFTDALETAKKNETPNYARTTKVYPYAPGLVAGKLARLIVDAKPLDSLIKTGALKPARYASDGRLLSVEFEGQRIRVTTLQKLVSGEVEKRRRKASTKTRNIIVRQVSGMMGDLFDSLEDLDRATNNKPGFSR